MEPAHTLSTDAATDRAAGAFLGMACGMWLAERTQRVTGTPGRTPARRSQDDALTQLEAFLAGAATEALHGQRPDARGGPPAFSALATATWQAVLHATLERTEPTTRLADEPATAALRAAWSSTLGTPVPLQEPAAGRFQAQHLENALRDAMTASPLVAGMAGALLGARWGASAVPAAWTRDLLDPRGQRARDAERIGITTARRAVGLSPDDGLGWPSGPGLDLSDWPLAAALAVHPHDDRVLLGGFRAVVHPPAGVDAVVSLTRLGRSQWPAPGVAERDHVVVWLADSGHKRNPHLDFVLHEAAGAVAALRSEGRTVLIHCVAAQSRTPTVAALYSALHLGVEPRRAVKDVAAALPGAWPNRHFQAAIRRLVGRA